MSLYCIQILHAKLGSFWGKGNDAFLSPLMMFADAEIFFCNTKQNLEGEEGGV